jgi:aquaporin Z
VNHLKLKEEKQMADVITSQPKSVALAAVPEWATHVRKYAVEAIGAFFLTFVVAVSVLSGSVFTPLAAGATLMVMIYAGGHISGGHYNPAVTMGALVRGRIGIGDAVPYWIAQVVGGVIAGALARAVVNPATVKTLTLSGHAEAAAAVVELLLTFALCYVMLNVATSKDQPGNGFFGLAIGFTVTAGAFAVGGISGGVFNPAVALGGATAGIFAWSTIWVYIVVQLGAGIAAGLAFLALNPGDGWLRTYTGGPNLARDAGSNPVPAPPGSNP